jgi:TonB family protein
MNGKEGQTAEPDSQDTYEASVLDFLEKEITADQPAQESKGSSDELDALVSDLMKQVMTESDPPQAGDKTESEEMAGLLLDHTFSEKQAAPPEVKKVLTLQEAQSSWIDAKNELIAEFMAPQEEAPPADNRIEPVESEPELSSFETMGDVLAEFLPPPEDTPTAGTEPAQTNPEPKISRPDPVAVMPAEPLPPKRETSFPESKNAADIPEPLSGKAKPVLQKAAAPKPNGVNKKPKTKSSDILKLSDEIAPAPGASSTRATPKPAKSISAVPVALSSKTLYIAAACFCLLAVIGIPVYYFSGPSNNTSNRSQPAVAGKLPAAASPAAPNDQVPAVPISKVAPKYPELGAKNRASASVVLELSIDRNGKVVKATPVSGPELFYSEAVSAAMKWQYRPASIGGVNVPSQSKVTFNFNLKN